MHKPRRRKLPVAALALATALSAGCSYASSFVVEPKGFVTSGWYVGEDQGVMLFVERITFAETQKGLMGIDLYLINKRPESVGIDLGQARLNLPDRSAQANETHVLLVKPGEGKDVSLVYRTDLGAEGIARATLELDGLFIQSSGGPARKGPRFEIPIVRVEEE
jgi:hypothetical protein